MPPGGLDPWLAAAVDQCQTGGNIPNEIRRNLAWIEVSAGAYAAAVAHCEQVLASDAGDFHVRQVLARALLQRGDADRAIEILEQQGTPSRGFLGYAYAVTGRSQAAEAIAVADARFPARQALIWAGLGRAGEAFEALQRMVANGEPRAGMYLTYPELSGLRADSRFADLRARLLLP